MNTRCESNEFEERQSENLKRVGIYKTSRLYNPKERKVYPKNPYQNQNHASWGISLCTPSKTCNDSNVDQTISLKVPLPVPSLGLVSVSVGISCTGCGGGDCGGGEACLEMSDVCEYLG